MHNNVRGNLTQLNTESIIALQHASEGNDEFQLQRELNVL